MNIMFSLNPAYGIGIASKMLADRPTAIQEQQIQFNFTRVINSHGLIYKGKPVKKITYQIDPLNYLIKPESFLLHTK